MRQLARTSAVCGILLLLAAGCRQEISSSQVASAQEGLGKARQLITDGDFEAALPLVGRAVDDPGLDADQYVEAVVLRARCYAETGEIEKAKADLAEAEQGDPDQALLHLTRGVILLRQGDTAESKREFSKAKRLNPSLTIPK